MSASPPPLSPRPLSPSFVRILAAGRERFNRRVAETRRRQPGFDNEAFAAFLRVSVDGVVAAVDAVAPSRSAAVALCAYDMALSLVAQGLVGPRGRNRLLEQTWVQLAPLLAARIAEAPEKVLAALSNAAVYLGSSPGLRGGDWLALMAQLSGRAESVTQLLILGQVLAWRAGASHFRESALAAAAHLPDALALAAVGADGGIPWSRVQEQLWAQPWWSPSSVPGCRQVRVVGNFTGLGGCFPQPPELRPCVSGFWVKSGERYSLLMADAWGAVLHPATAGEYAQAGAEEGGALGNALPTLGGTNLYFTDETIPLDLPAEGLALVCNRHSAALTSPYSHRIRLYPR